MTSYPPKVNARFSKPKNAGNVQGTVAVGIGASFECGSFVRISLDIENDAKIIRVAKFQSNGCGFMIAAADAVAERLAGIALADLHGFAGNYIEGLTGDDLEEFPASRTQCTKLVFTALRDALAKYRAYAIKEFTGEAALICTCFGVSEETIELIIAEISPLIADDVAEACKAGAGCGSCRMIIQEMIDGKNFETR